MNEKYCKLKLGNETNGIELSYLTYKGTWDINVGVYSNKKASDFCLDYKYPDDIAFLNSLKNFTLDSNKIIWKYEERYFNYIYDIHIYPKAEKIYISTYENDEDDNETVVELEYNLNEKEIKKFMKFVKELNKELV